MILTKLCHNFTRQNTANDHTDSPTQDMTLSNTVNEEFRVHLNNTSTNLNGVGYAHLTKKLKRILTPLLPLRLTCQWGCLPPASGQAKMLLHTSIFPESQHRFTHLAHLVPTYTYSPRPLMSSRTSILQSTAEEFSHCNLAPALQTSTPFSLVKWRLNWNFEKQL